MDQAWRKPFFTLYVGQAFSLLSSSAVQFALIWWITVKTGSAIDLTLASVAGLLPQVVIGPFAGVLVDRHSRKAVMILADLAVAASSLALALAFVFGEPPLAFIYVILFLRALGETFHKPALQAAIPSLVPQAELQRAGGLGQLVTAICSMAGPLLGAFLAEALPFPIVMLIDVGGAALAVLAISGVTVPGPAGPAPQRSGLLAELREGFHALATDKPLVRATLIIFATSMVFMPLGSLLPLLVREHFRGGAWQGGLVQAVFSVGMLASALAIGITGGSKRPFALISFSTLLLGVCSFVGGLLPSHAFWAFCAVAFAIGSTGMMGTIPYMAYLQKSVAPAHLGKVISTVTSFISLGIPLGMVVAGPTAEAFGVGRWMVGVGILLTLLGSASYLATRRFDRVEASLVGPA